MADDWRERAIARAASAQRHLVAGDLEAADADLDAAFGIVEGEGNEDDIVFLVVLLAAADCATACDEVEASASLYRRVAEKGAQFEAEAESTTDLDLVQARAAMGLARADVARGHDERAWSRYLAALKFLRRLPDVPAEVIEEARRGAARVPPGSAE